jgi:hypothetical protein
MIQKYKDMLNCSDIASNSQQSDLISPEKALRQLSEKRPAFHSESDFQHAFAWQLHLQHPNIELRLEYSHLVSGRPIHIDIIAKGNGLKIPIELKYKVKKQNFVAIDEEYALSYQGAHCQGRFDFLKDIARIEQFCSQVPSPYGYAIFLSNDSAYWNAPGKGKYIDIDFRLTHGRTAQGDLRWGSSATEGARQKRSENILLTGQHKLAWRNYWQDDEQKVIFKYLIVKVMRT